MVITSAPSARAVARVVAVCAVLAGLFLMHGLVAEDCHGGAGASASSMSHSAAVPAAMAGLDTTAKAMTMASVDVPLTRPGTVCVSTPPPSGVAGLLALLLAFGIVVLAGAVARPDPVSGLRPHRRRAPPLAGVALLTNLCVSRT